MTAAARILPTGKPMTNQQDILTRLDTWAAAALVPELRDTLRDAALAPDAQEKNL